MPKMTRAQFLERHENVWLTAVENFRTAGYLANILIGYDAMGRETTWMAGPPAPSPDAPSREREDWDHANDVASSIGATVIPGRFKQHIEQIKAHARDNKVVACISISENWHATNEVAAEIQRMGIPVREHPLASESITVIASWPREIVSLAYGRLIERDDQGHPTLGEPLDIPRSEGMVMFGWVNEICPPMPGRPAQGIDFAMGAF